MTKIDWSKYTSDTKIINLKRSGITELIWEGCPSGLKEIDLGYNMITEFKWENCPKGLEEIHLEGPFFWESFSNLESLGFINTH